MKQNYLYQFDEKYTPFAGASIVSLLDNSQNAKDVCVFVLGSEISADSRKKFLKQVEKYNSKIVFLPSEKLEEEVMELGMPSYRGSQAANLRLFVDKVVPKDVKRLVYLDSDTAIVGDMSQLFEMDMKGHPIGMVQDSLVRYHKKAIGIGNNDPYYNSGMIVFDMDKWREANCTQKIVSHIKEKRAAYPNPDQDLLNVVFYNDIYTISPKYNFQPVHVAFCEKHYFEVYGQCGYYDVGIIKDAKKDVKMFHFFRFVGQFPWHKNSIHPDKEIFYKYLSLSEWSDFIPWETDIGIVFKIEKILYKILPEVIFLWIFHYSHEIFTVLEDKRSKKLEKSQ